jgi:hypothetical protein
MADAWTVGCRGRGLWAFQLMSSRRGGSAAVVKGAR